MKKIASVFLSLLLIVMPLYAFANDYSNMTTEELKTELDKIMLEISKKNTNTDKLLCDTNDFTIYVTGDVEIVTNMFDETKQSLVIPITAFNESDQHLSLFMDKISINGWEVETYEIFELDANKKLKDTIDIPSFIEHTDITSVLEIKEIEAYYYVCDEQFNTISKKCRTAVIFDN